MSEEIKAGMLCLVVGSNYCPENIGKSFVVSEADADSTALIESDDILGFDVINRVKGNFGHAWVMTNHLIPINPEQDPLEITEKGKEYAR